MTGGYEEKRNAYRGLQLEETICALCKATERNNTDNTDHHLPSSLEAIPYLSP